MQFWGTFPFYLTGEKKKSDFNRGNFEYCHKFGIQSTPEYHWTRATFRVRTGA